MLRMNRDPCRLRRTGPAGLAHVLNLLENKKGFGTFWCRTLFGVPFGYPLEFTLKKISTEIFEL